MTLDERGGISLAYDASKAGQTADAALFSVAECPVSGLLAQDVLFASKQALERDEEVFLESYVCTLNPGKTMADADAAIAVQYRSSGAIVA